MSDTERDSQGKLPRQHREDIGRREKENNYCQESRSGTTQDSSPNISQGFNGSLVPVFPRLLS